MTALRFTIRPKAPFGSPLLGETLFGQLCWAILRLYGKERLEALLDGYCEGRPFAVVADAFPKGCIPLPALPAQFWAQHDDSDRKYLKKKAWMPLAVLSEPLSRWRDLSYTDAEAAQRFSSDSSSLRITGPRVHNTINRRTLTTGTGVFAPYMKSDTWFNQNIPLCVQIVLDETRIDRAEFAQALEYVGLSGFGRDASVGLGKYEMEGEPEVLPAPRAAKVHITLASCVLSSVPDILPAKTYYKARTHFGRHGDVLAVAGAPFKRPLLLAAAGACVETKLPTSAEFFGCGIGGVSPSQPQAVHQGYAPVIAVL